MRDIKRDGIIVIKVGLMNGMDFMSPKVYHLPGGRMTRSSLEAEQYADFIVSKGWHLKGANELAQMQDEIARLNLVRDL